jgi:NADH-quinone oxidoreductase subunit H
MVVGLDLFFRVLIFPGLTFIGCLTMLCDWFERKIEARIQNRVGPKFTGPSGILQPLADFVKLLAKEDIVPVDTKQLIFNVAPVTAFTIILFAFCFLPIDGSTVIPGTSFQGDLIFVMALITVANFLLFLSGWASVNPYSMLGAARVLTQFLGYDLPLLFLALCPAFLTGSLSLTEIVAHQTIPFVVLIPWAFVLFIITMQAELEKDPFDVPHAESEIVAGYETEYSGRKLAFLKLARDTQIVFGAALVTVLFLGGSSGPVFFGANAVWGTLWFLLKLIVVIAISEYITCLFARLRIDQVVSTNWRWILPLSLLSLASTMALAFWVYPAVM